jgi:3-dehydroquinate synthase
MERYFGCCFSNRSNFAGLNKFVITDENYLAGLQKLRDKTRFRVHNQHTETMEKAYLGRDTLVIASAAVQSATLQDSRRRFRRGVPVIHILTTPRAGRFVYRGKTGVDSSISKNAFGVFWHPAAVYIDVATLTTLDERQFRAGLVESVKHAIIADSEYFVFLESNLDAVLERNSGVLEKVAHWNCKIKGKVVEIDPGEKNLRRILNTVIR